LILPECWNVNEMRILCEIRNTSGKVYRHWKVVRKKKKTIILLRISTFHFGAAAGIPKLGSGERVNDFNLPPVVHLLIVGLRTHVEITHIIYTHPFKIDI